MKTKTLVASLVSLVLVLFGSTAWAMGAPPPRQEPMPTVRMVFNQYTGDLPFFVAKELGFFAKHKVNIEVKEARDSSEALNALLAGQADIINPISFSAMIAAEAKAPGLFKLFLPGGEDSNIVGSYLLVSKNSTVTELSQLKGKKIGTYTGATQLLYLKLFLKEAGYDPENDFEIVQVGFDIQAQALEAGQFDALFTIEPTASAALQKNLARVLIENPRVKYIVNPFISGSAAVSTDFISKNPNAVKRVYAAIADAIDFIRANEGKSREILAKYAALDASLAAKMPLLQWYKTDEKVDMDAVQKIADLMYENGLVKVKVDLRQMMLETDQIK
jgi:NitT/TauT family transport system substrate-binding protein